MSVNESISASSFPHPVLTRLHEAGRKPTRTQILVLKTELNANAASVDSLYGAHGHLFLTLSAAEYHTLSGIQFEIPGPPPMNPPPHAAGAAAHVTAEAVRQHGVEWKSYKLMRRVETELRNQLLAAADDTYWRRMRMATLGYGTRTVRELFTHMVNTYGRFTEAERREAASKMEVPWEGGPLEVTIQQIQDTADAFALGGTEFNDDQKRDKLYDLVSTSNLLSDACQRWRMLPEAQKTWDAACDHFQTFANDRDEVLTTGTAGYTANHVEEALTQTSAILADINAQMANLSERNVLQSTSITDLQCQLAASDASLHAYRDANRNNGNNRNNNGNNNGNNGNNRNGNNNNGNDRDRPPRLFNKYCYTHGMCDHLGPACRNPCSTHKNEATAANKMGGSLANT
jgi:hypothetical protein